ncbi:putative Reverse transcriptase like [Trypanosoma vivax]|nr:putative Reverse transcriptase like [Trypanosoma vivax]
MEGLTVAELESLLAHAARQGRRWIATLLEKNPVELRRHRRTSATFVTDASMYGWRAPLSKDSGEVCVAGNAWDREPHCISQGEARAVPLALTSLAEAMPKNLHICIDNTAVMNIIKKGNTHSDALMRVPSLIVKALQGQGVQASWAHIASAENCADGISRGNRLGKADVAKGSSEGGVKNAFPLLPFVSHSF